MAAIELYSTPLFSDANIVSYWRLENANDAVGSNNGTGGGTVAYNSTYGKFNNGVDFSGTGYLSFGTAAGLDFGAADATFMTWVTTPSTFGTDKGIAIRRSTVGGATTTVSLCLFFEGSSSKLCSYDGNASTILRSSSALSTNTQYHVAATFNKSTGNMILYVNGSQVASGSQSNLTTITDNFILGATEKDGTGKILTGFDDAAFFSRILTPTEISNYYNGTWGTGNFFMFM